jgi:hypothetical protein
MESTNDATPITTSIELCIADLNIEVEDTNCISESIDYMYVEPVESCVKTPMRKGRNWTPRNVICYRISPTLNFAFPTSML